MPANDSPVLVVATTAPTADAVAWIAERYGGRGIVAVYLGDDAETWPLGDGCERWMRGDLEDLERLRRDFLEFLEAWPRQSFRATGGRSFDDAFRRGDGYSLWWTGPGLARHPDRGVFPKLRDISAIATAIERSRCTNVVLLSAAADVARIVSDRCREDGIAFDVPPGYAAPQPSTWRGQLAYFAAAVANYVVSPWIDVLRAIVCRRRVRCKSESRENRERPAVVATALFPREFRRDIRNGGDAASIAFWSEVAAEFERRDPGIRFRYLLHTTRDRLNGLGPDRLHCHRAWPELRRLDGLAPLPNQTVGWWAWLRAGWPFIHTLCNFLRIERDAAFRGSFRFAGCDVAPLYAPLFRKTIARTHKWAQSVAAFEASLRAVGNVRALLLMGELYEFAMPAIAAARRLGISTIGAQHGTIFPMHLVYTVPRAQIDAAPTPDRFAVYGEFAKETLTQIGAFPADRVVVTGSPRFDHLAQASTDAITARQVLELPSDKHVFLLATQTYPWFKTAARALLDATAARQDCIVCVKTHPHDASMDDYRRLAAEAGARNVRFFADRFNELLAACDVLVSGSSTATLEAILLGRRTICVNFSSESDRYPYVAEGGSLGAANAEELRAAIDAAIDPRLAERHAAARRHFLERHLGPTADGQAAAVFVQTVLDEIGGDRRIGDSIRSQ
ncbi:MAG: hypothetical protein WD875_10130 [Pirellulales bacterium]